MTATSWARGLRAQLVRERPTAIIYDNDVMAIAGLGVAQEMGLTVPAELSIVAWNDTPLCRLVHPALTALSRDIPAYGAQAAQRLLGVIGNDPPSSVQNETARGHTMRRRAQITTPTAITTTATAAKTRIHQGTPSDSDGGMATAGVVPGAGALVAAGRSAVSAPTRLITPNP